MARAPIASEGWRGPLPSAEKPLPTTLLQLVVGLQGCGLDEAQVVAAVASLVREGTVVLTGNFAGSRLRLDPFDESMTS